eukprot:scaffold1889_cov176-Alexandrium_tamarense.AAC.2
MDKVKISGKTDMSDVDLIIHITASVPEKYEVRLTSGADKIDIEIDEDIHTDELAAFAKQFKRRCKKCGMDGHKAATCPSVKNDGGDPGTSASDDAKPKASTYLRGKKCFLCG